MNPASTLNISTAQDMLCIDTEQDGQQCAGPLSFRMALSHPPSCRCASHSPAALVPSQLTKALRCSSCPFERPYPVNVQVFSKYKCFSYRQTASIPSKWALLNFKHHVRLNLKNVAFSYWNKQ